MTNIHGIRCHLDGLVETSNVSSTQEVSFIRLEGHRVTLCPHQDEIGSGGATHCATRRL